MSPERVKLGVHCLAVLVLIKGDYSKGNCSSLITHRPGRLENTSQENRVTA